MLQYKIMQKLDPREPTLPGKFYAQLTNRYQISFNEMLKEVSVASAVSIGDTYNVLHTLTEVIQRHLENGRGVSLGDLGRIFITISSEGRDTPGEVDAHAIKRGNVRYTPGWRLKDAMRHLKFQKVENGESPPGNGKKGKSPNED